MKFGLMALLTLAFSLSALSQQHFGLLKFKIPELWQQQTRAEFESYTAPNTSNDGVTEIIIYAQKPSAVKIDSSFRTEWRRLVNQVDASGQIPVARKRTTYSGIRYAENGTEVKHENGTSYMQLLVFSINNQVQSVALFAKDLNSFRHSRDQVFDFMESIESLVKIEELP